MQDNNDVVVNIENLGKSYKMFKSKKDRLIEVMLPKWKRHTDFEAIKDLNLQIRQGEVLGILGKNGAGKSTLLKMITGVAVPTKGKIEINGKISSLLELGTAFNPELTGEENIYQHRTSYGTYKEGNRCK